MGLALPCEEEPGAAGWGNPRTGGGGSPGR